MKRGERSVDSNSGKLPFEVILILAFIAILHVARLSILVAFLIPFSVDLISLFIFLLSLFLSVEILPLLGLFRLREEAPGIAIGYGLMAPFALTLIGLYSSIFPLIFLYIGLLEVTLILGLLSQRHFRLQTEARMQHTHVFTKETYYAGVAIQVIRLILVAIGTIAVYFANEVWSVIYGQNALIMVGVNVICVAGLVLRKEWGYHLATTSLVIGIVFETTFAQTYVLIPNLYVLFFMYFLQFAILSKERFKQYFVSH
jgi:hypothetical protein